MKKILLSLFIITYILFFILIPSIYADNFNILILPVFTLGLFLFFELMPRAIRTFGFIGSLKNNEFSIVLLLWAASLSTFEEIYVSVPFQIVLNGFIKELMGESQATYTLYNVNSMYVITSSFVGLLGLISWIQIKHYLFPTIAFCSYLFIKSVAHILICLLGWIYLPGIYTTVFLILPLTIAYYFTIKGKYQWGGNLFKFGLMWAVIAHFLIVFGLFLVNYFKLVDAVFYYLFLAFWAAIPCFVFNKSEFSVAGEPDMK